MKKLILITLLFSANYANAATMVCTALCFHELLGSSYLTPITVVANNENEAIQKLNNKCIIRYSIGNGVGFLRNAEFLTINLTGVNGIFKEPKKDIIKDASQLDFSDICDTQELSNQ